jgi:hypothetical protein
MLEGMSNTNMKLVLLSVSLPGDLEVPTQKLDPGEFITKRVVELSKLTDELKSKSFFPCLLMFANARSNRIP